MELMANLNIFSSRSVLFLEKIAPDGNIYFVLANSWLTKPVKRYVFRQLKFKAIILKRC